MAVNAFEHERAQQRIAQKAEADRIFALSVQESESATKMAIEMEERSKADVVAVGLSSSPEQMERGGSTPFTEDRKHPNAVAWMPIPMQRGFRRKTLGLLSLSLVAVIGIMLATVHTPLAKVEGIYVVIAFMVMLVALALLALQKEKYPQNYVLLSLFIICFGLFFGVSDQMFLSNANLQLLIYGGLNMVWVSIISTLNNPVLLRALAKNDSKPQDQPQLVPIKYACVFAWSITFLLGFAVQVTAPGKRQMGHYVTVQVCSMILMAWLACDFPSIEETMEADQYMMGVILFYSDLLVVFGCVVCCAGWFGSS